MEENIVLQEINKMISSLGRADLALIITAISSLLGVALAAILNFWSNIKTNKANIKLEERKVRYPYLKESFDVLLETSKKIDEIELDLPKKINIKNKDSIKTKELIIDSCFKVLDLLKSVEPYLIKHDRDILMCKYKEIELRNNKIRSQYWDQNEEKMTDEEFGNFFTETGHLMVHLKHEFRDVLSKELTRISDVLREYILH